LLLGQPHSHLHGKLPRGSKARTRLYWFRTTADSVHTLPLWWSNMAPDSRHHHNHVLPSPTATLNSTSTNPSSRRNSTRRRRRSSIMLLSPTSDGGSGSAAVEESWKQLRDSLDSDDQEEIAITSTGKTAGKTITPFLAKHIPNTYNPMGQQSAATMNTTTTEPEPANNTKYCNRHRPDRKCRRQADGPSMEQLQSELSSLSHSDRVAISHVWSVFSASPAKQRELILQGRSAPSIL
jgi:hypothetical protein